MDQRVSELIDELASSAAIDPKATRDRISDLFHQVSSEEDRVALLHTFDAVMQITFRHIGENEGLRNAVIADKRTFALAEAMGPNELVDPARLHYVMEREIAAGRMERDSFAELASAGAEVLGPIKSKPKGWMARMLRR